MGAVLRRLLFNSWMVSRKMTRSAWASRLWRISVPSHRAAQEPALGLSLETSRSRGCASRPRGLGVLIEWVERPKKASGMEREGPAVHSALG